MYSEKPLRVGCPDSDRPPSLLSKAPLSLKGNATYEHSPRWQSRVWPGYGLRPKGTPFHCERGERKKKARWVGLCSISRCPSRPWIVTVRQPPQKTGERNLSFAVMVGSPLIETGARRMPKGPQGHFGEVNARPNAPPCTSKRGVGCYALNCRESAEQSRKTETQRRVEVTSRRDNDKVQPTNPVPLHRNLEEGKASLSCFCFRPLLNVLGDLLSRRQKDSTENIDL